MMERMSDPYRGTDTPEWRHVTTVPVNVETLGLQCPTCGVPVNTIDGDLSTNGADVVVRSRPCGHDAVVTLDRFGI